MKKRYDVAQIFMSGKKQISIPKILVGLSLAALLFSAADGTAWAKDTNWNTAVRGNWYDAANWDNGVPVNDGDRAFLTFNDAIVDYWSATNPILDLVSIDNFTSLVHQADSTLTTNYLTVGETSGVSSSNMSAYHLAFSTSCLVVNNNMTIGRDGAGMFDHWNGDVIVNGEYGALNLGNLEGSEGYYYLYDGSLTLNGHEEYIGEYGTGYFFQSGGIHTLNGAMYLGVQQTGYGYYEMSGGLLTSGSGGGGIALGEWGGTGSFWQSGGDIYVDSIQLARQENSTGNWVLEDGTVTTDRLGIGIKGQGTFTQYDGAITVNDNLVLSGETGSVGEYFLSGGLLQTGETHVSAVGTNGTFEQTGGQHDTNTLFIGYYASGIGTYNLQVGDINARWERIGLKGDGTFNQYGGTNMITGDLVIGQEEGSSGTYNMSAGVLDVGGNEYVGQAGYGTFNQYGGATQHMVHGDLYVDVGVASKGLFNLDDGSLTVDGFTIVGNTASATGEFNQYGGTNTVNGGYEIWSNDDGSWKQYAGLVLGRNGGSGIYEQTGGTLSVANATIVGADGNGVFTLGNGSSPTTHTTGDLYVGYDTKATEQTGTYNLYDNGELVVAGGNGLMGFTVVGGKDYGPAGNGEFNQYGGTHTTGGLFLSDNSESYGSYYLHGGDLNVGDWEVIGGVGAGDFSQDGGTHTTSGDVIIGMNGTYWMTGGDFLVGNDILNDHLFHMEIADGAGTLTALTFLNNGTLEGTGTITANVENYGLLSAGNSPGVMNIAGDLFLGDTSKLFFELGGTTQGTEYDYLHITGLATLGGSLEVELYDFGFGGGTFNPNIGDTFTILFADGGFDGTIFSNYILPDLADGKKWSVAYNDYDVTLHVNAVPVPPAVFLLASGLVSLFMVKRRKV